MRSLLHNLFQPKIEWNFQKADYSEFRESLKNPARGWYKIFPFCVEEKPDYEELYWCLNKEHTLALVIINIGFYREKSLDAQALENVREILNFFRQHSYDVILRVVYDHQGNAIEREPFFFKQVVEHLEQLAPIIGEVSDTVFVYQGMLIGNWGEMHTSRFLAPEKLKQLWNILCAHLPKTVYLAVRRPAIWRMLHPESCGKQVLLYDTTGLFDDAIFGSESHLGTFGIESKETTGWDGIWKREEELEFEELLCRKVPNGGEAVCGPNYSVQCTPKDTVETLRQMHITYLNQAYDEKILNLWKQWRWKSGSLYEYIGAHLGYRFWVKDADISYDKKAREFCLKLTLKNLGFANIYQETEVCIELEYPDGTYTVIKTNWTAEDWDSNVVQELTCLLPVAEYELFLSVLRKSDGRRIFFANEAEKKGRVKLGRITDLHKS